MAFLANNELSQVLQKNISDGLYNPKNVQNASYELSLGDEIYSNNDEAKTILNEQNPQYAIKPGQLAILITKEEIEIPRKYIGFISIKFGVKFRGLVNISGFHVDPGFKGKLKFSVYNAGSKPIFLERGKPYFVLWLSSLSSELDKDQEYNGRHQGQDSILTEDVMKVNGVVASPNELLSKITEIESKFESEYRSNNDRRWWVYKTVIGLLVAIVLKLLWDSNSYKTGYDNGLNESTKIETTRLQLNDELNKIFTYKIDSINRAITEIQVSINENPNHEPNK